MNIELHIEELILHGFAAADRTRIAEALQSELERLLTADHPPQAFEEAMDLPRLDGGSFNVHASERPDAIGARLGQAVSSALAVHDG